MKTNLSLVGLALLAGAAASAYAQPVLYYVPGTPTDMNADGSVVVGSAGNDEFRWSRTGNPSYVLLGSGSGGIACTDATGDLVSGDMDNVNDVGGFNFGADRSLAGRWTASTGWNDMGLFNGNWRCDFTINSNYAMSRDGRFSAGGGWLLSCSRYRAWVYDSNTGLMTALTPLPGLPPIPPPGFDPKDYSGNSQRANAISDDGTVVAGYDHHPQNGVRRPAVWRNDMEVVLANSGEIFSMTPDGLRIYGWSGDFGSNHLVKWTWNGSMWVPTDLGMLPSGAGSLSPVAVNADGSVIAGVVGSGAGGFINVDEEGVVDFSTWISSFNVPGNTNISFDRVTALDFDGRTIGGHMVVNVPESIGIINMGFVIDLDGGPCLPPQLSQNLAQWVRNPGQTALFNVFHGGAAPFTYQWYKNGIPLTDTITNWNSDISGAETPALRLTNIAPQDSGRYTVRITNACGDITTSAGTLTVAGWCPADFSGSADPNDPAYGTPDLAVDSSDFFFYLDMFVAGNLGVADLTGSSDPNDSGYGVPDGMVDAADFFYFLDLFVQGCP